MNKTYPSAAAALADLIQDGQTLAIGGFGLCGIPEKLIAALEKQVCVIFTVSLLLLIARLVLVCVCGDGGIVMVVVVVRVCPFVCAC